MKTPLLLLVFLAALSGLVFGQDNTKAAEPGSEVPYVHLPLPPGTLNEEGQPISHLLVLLEEASRPDAIDTTKLKSQVFEYARPNMSSFRVDPFEGQQTGRSEYHRVEAFYQKVHLQAEALDENGHAVSFVFVPADIERDYYEVFISDYKEGLFEILRTDMYVKFRSYRGFRIYSSLQAGILAVDANPRLSRFYVRF